MHFKNIFKNFTESDWPFSFHVRLLVLRWSSPLAKMIKSLRMSLVMIVILAAGVLEGRGEGGVVARVRDRELVIELRHVGHDEELVRGLAPHNIVNVQQLRNT